MAEFNGDTEFVVKLAPSGDDLSEFRQSMNPHPLWYQEIPHDPKFGIYNRRLRSLEYATIRSEELYWRLRRHVVLAHTGELATEVRGPGAEAMLDRVFTRDISRVPVGRCSYELACFHDGGMIMDGVLLRLGAERFWYAQGDGEFPLWLRAQAEGFDVEVSSANVWVSQIQGPRSMDVLEQVADDGVPEPFRYFDLARIHIAEQPVVISRTGFTNELGWEVYIGPDADADIIGARILEAGEPHGIHTIPAAATNARRIEAGLLLSGVDFDDSVTPFAAGLGAFVDLDKAEFIGKEALESADKRRRTWGLGCPDGVPRHGEVIYLGDELAGRVNSSAWSPYLQRGIGIVRLADADHGPGTELSVECTDGERHACHVCELPMYDRGSEIARGIRVDIPEIPASG